MTTILNQSQFANLSGVSKQAVSKGIKDKLIVKNEDGKIDISDPINAKYLSSSKHKRPNREVIIKKPITKEKPRAPKPEPPKPKTIIKTVVKQKPPEVHTHIINPPPGPAPGVLYK